MYLRLYGDPRSHPTPSGRAVKRAQQFFLANPSERFCMLSISQAELRSLNRLGLLSGWLGRPRSHEVNTHRSCAVTFDQTGRIWIVAYRDWRCIDPFTGGWQRGYTPADIARRQTSDPHLYPWPVPGFIVVPQLPSDLPPLDADQANVAGRFLWEDWEASTGKGDATAEAEAELAARAVCTLWGAL
jgi:hypothetical protein